ncbi:hypothetical protein JW948_17325 [bacterium]|nr:hypothetical protein [bacterium]
MKNLFLILSGLMIFTACERQTTDTLKSDADMQADLVQLDGCQRGGLEKTAGQDSCFTWTFDDVLTTDFCVEANCCPDSGRFVLDYRIDGSLIHVAVTDTAGNLCRCNCPYLIHTEFADLTKDTYLFEVEYNGSRLYSENISR